MAYFKSVATPPIYFIRAHWPRRPCTKCFLSTYHEKLKKKYVLGFSGKIPPFIFAPPL